MCETKSTENKTLTEQILELPGKIKTQSIAIADLSLSVERKRLIPAEIRNRHKQEIANTKEQGKLKYSNEDSRKAELEARISKDGEYSSAITDLNIAERQLRREELELRYLVNQFDALRSVAMLTAVGVEE